MGRQIIISYQSIFTETRISKHCVRCSIGRGAGPQAFLNLISWPCGVYPNPSQSYSRQMIHYILIVASIPNQIGVKQFITRNMDMCPLVQFFSLNLVRNVANM